MQARGHLQGERTKNCMPVCSEAESADATSCHILTRLLKPETLIPDPELLKAASVGPWKISSF